MDWFVGNTPFTYLNAGLNKLSHLSLIHGLSIWILTQFDVVQSNMSI